MSQLLTEKQIEEMFFFYVSMFWKISISLADFFRNVAVLLHGNP